MAIEGKTKRVSRIMLARSAAKDALTAGNGALRAALDGKAALSTTTTSNVFALLKYCGEAVAFYCQDSPTSFIGEYCSMFAWEVVARREAHGSILKRNVSLKKGDRFDELVVELYLKTSDRRHLTYDLPCDDPFVVLTPKDAFLHLPDVAFVPGAYFLRLAPEQVFRHKNEAEHIERMKQAVSRAFRILEYAWSLLGYRLVDLKVEFGMSRGKLYLADVIDNDSWRLLDEAGNYVDKQPFRDGADIELVLRNYRLVAELSNAFRDPKFQKRVAAWVKENL